MHIVVQLTQKGGDCLLYEMEGLCVNASWCPGGQGHAMNLGILSPGIMTGKLGILSTLFSYTQGRKEQIGRIRYCMYVCNK